MIAVVTDLVAATVEEMIGEGEEVVGGVGAAAAVASEASLVAAVFVTVSEKLTKSKNSNS